MWGRFVTVAGIAVAAPFVASAAAAAQQVTASATVQASVVKPLVLTRVQDLDLGTILLGTGNWSTATVSLTRNGVFTCSANLTCSGLRQVAVYNVSGTNKQVVRINAPNVTLVNQSDSSQTLILEVDRPQSLTLVNSGPPGSNFSLGGSITLNATTAAGTYSGIFNVTVEYQ